MQVDTGGALHHPVRDAGGNLASQSVIYSILAPAARDIVPSIDLFEQQRNVFRLVLQVPIERYDDVALCLIETGGQRPGLSEVAAQSKHLQVTVGLDQVCQ